MRLHHAVGALTNSHLAIIRWGPCAGVFVPHCQLVILSLFENMTA